MIKKYIIRFLTRLLVIRNVVVRGKNANLPLQQLMGHAQYKCEYEENSMALFHYLIDGLGFRIIECDVRFSNEGVPMLSHADLNDNREHATLEQLLNFVSKKNVWVMLDMSHEVISMKRAYIIYRLLKKYDMEYRCILADGGIMRFAIFDSNLTYQIQGVLSENMILDAKNKLNICSNIILSQSLWLNGGGGLCDKLISFAHRQGILTKVAVVNNKEQACNFFEIGVDLIMTDELVNSCI